MIKKRLIANLLVHDGQVVQTRRFKPTNVVGNPFTAVDFFNSWSVDEIMILDISRSAGDSAQFTTLVSELSRRCFVPLSVGGKIAQVERVGEYTRAGADKVVINTHAVRRPALLREIADAYGSQCLIVSIDARPNPDFACGYEVVVDNGREPAGLDAVEWMEQAIHGGAGEVMINSLMHDGDKQGYDLDLLRTVSARCTVPLIAMGGVGEWEHFVEGLTEAGADAVAAGNIFHYTEHSTKVAKQYLFDRGLPVRPPTFYQVAMPRKPRYRAY